ncbi:MAG: hypothetical protein M1822_009322 [Bathelium mastoideum]|nr:MAG: hypothetical protein M1822_009322 [Bathelium mastoideum]
MPGLVRKLLIYAAVDGLILQPFSQRNSAAATASAIRIDYKNHAINPVLHDWHHDENSHLSLEAHGIVGLLSISSRAYLISISRRKQVAKIQGKPIYVIQDVALIPLASQVEANAAISAAREQLIQDSQEPIENAIAEDESIPDNASSTLGKEEASPGSPATPARESEEKTAADKGHKKTTSVVEDVISKRGAYGRFAERWFSKAGWSSDKRRTLGMSSQDDVTKSAAVGETSDSTEQHIEAINTAAPGELAVEATELPSSMEPSRSSEMSMILLPKLLRTTRLLLSSNSFFYSYEYDLSHSLWRQPSLGSTAPLFKQFDPLFFWNHHLSMPFVDAGQNSFVLPLMQGFVGQKAFAIQKDTFSGNSTVLGAVESTDDVITAPIEESIGNGIAEQAQNPQSGEDSPNDMSQSFTLTLVSRRSVERAGLRYLRRGIDDGGHAANAVETEQILSSPTWSTDQKSYSFLQCRGSIPLYFSQSPYSFKPIPIMYGTSQANQMAFKQHFSNLFSRYGNVQVASLVDKHGTENQIGEEYQKQASSFNEHGGVEGKQIGFTWFDFHSVCRGMKFENVSLLIQELGTALSSHGWTVIKDGKLLQQQSGILRTNCMDCLDRTNVVQSATACWALEQQLAEQGFTIDLQSDPTTSWFNQIWADNGDAISRQYAGTAALKGDYTRTRKRNIAGALTDFTLTLNRYYHNIFGDYFTQACIDFLLGRTTEVVFDDFEADMKSKDLAMNMTKVRQSAIETCAKIVIEDHYEDLESGWTLTCPHEPNTLKGLPFEECVVLVTSSSLYLCRFDWSIEKVSEYTKVDLDQITSLQKGTYITSTMTSKQRDEERNYGFLVSYYAPTGKDLRRINTRSLESEKEPDEKLGEAEATQGGLDENNPKELSMINDKSKPVQGPKQHAQVRILAFKALAPGASAMKSDFGTEAKPQSESDLVENVCDDILRVATRLKKVGMDGPPERNSTIHVEEKPIISLADAKKSTTYLESIGHSIKRLVWA